MRLDAVQKPHERRAAHGRVAPEDGSWTKTFRKRSLSRLLPGGYGPRTDQRSIPQRLSAFHSAADAIGLTSTETSIACLPPPVKTP